MARIQDALWAINIACTIGLLVLLVRHKNHRQYPAFTAYAVIVLFQAVVLYFSYGVWGFASLTSWRISWGMQALATLARGLAVWEICWKLMGHYTGIWAFAWRVMAGAGTLVVLISIFAARHQKEILLPSLERGMQLAIACVIVVLMAFVRYYEMTEIPSARGLATGICMFSCFSVVNNTILERYLYQYTNVWNILSLLSYFASLMIWMWAVRVPPAARERRETMMPAAIYHTVVPEINVRLRMLNEQLAQVWRAGDTRS
jgi:hypothetical protein